MASAVAPVGHISRKHQDIAPPVMMPIVSPVMSTPAVSASSATTPQAVNAYPASTTASPVSKGSPVAPASHPMSSPMVVAQ